MIRRLIHRWRVGRMLKQLDREHVAERARFLEKIKKEGFTLLDDSQVVCDHCGANCGQCGIGVRAHRLTQQYDVLNAAHQLTRESFLRNV